MVRCYGNRKYRLLLINPIVIHNQIVSGRLAAGFGCKYLITDGFVSDAHHYSCNVAFHSRLLHPPKAFNASDVSGVSRTDPD
jgi:hypothetical protein